MSDDKKTLKPRGTLSVGGGAARSNSGAGVAVEVRRRRFGAPAAGQATTAAPTDEAGKRRQEILQQAQQRKDEEQQRRVQERQQVEQLRQAQTATEAEREQREREREAAKAAEAARLAAEQAAAQQAKSGGDAPRGPAKVAPRKTLSVGNESADRKPKSGKPGSEKDMFSKRGRNAYMDELEQRYRTMPGRKKERRIMGGDSSNAGPAEKVVRTVELPEFITVQELAKQMAEKGSEVVKKLMELGEMATLTQTIEQDTAILVIEEFGHKYATVKEDELEDQVAVIEDDAKDMKPRAPVVTVMGHVDHGKTSLLDSLRKSRVAAGEAGGITQHIGAYQVETKNDQLITFLDTPGHAAFTAMRARGANATDVVILVVAADDSVMPQTIEAIQHARAAGVPVVVAINKVDKPEANVEKVKQDLLQHDVVAEEYGGDIVTCPVSAKTGQGLDELLDMVMLQADVLELKANPNRRADGVIVESRLDKGRGPVATVIVQGGTLKKGDIVVAGSEWGRVRALLNDQGKQVKDAGPAEPVEILGLGGVPAAGDVFTVAENERQAKEVAEYRAQKQREKDQIAQRQALSLDNIFNRIAEGDITELPVIVKADVQGSVEAIRESLEKLASDEVKVRVIHSAVGVITENDVMLATASQALIVGFNVRADAKARELAEQDGVELRYYNVIYNLLDDVKAALSGLLSPDQVEEVIGRVEIRAIFKINKSKIAGCYVTDGKVERGSKVRLLREGTVIATTEIDSLRREKDEVKEVASGYECGLTLTDYQDFSEGDELEVFVINEIAKEFVAGATNKTDKQPAETTDEADDSAAA